MLWILMFTNGLLGNSTQTHAEVNILMSSRNQQVEVGRKVREHSIQGKSKSKIENHKVKILFYI